MAEEFLLNRYPWTEVDAILGKVDGFPVEEHTLEMSMTGYPVESGSEIIDHAVKLPDRLMMEGVVSDLMPFDRNNTTPSIVRNADAWQTIIQIMEKRQLVTVTTPVHTYRNMLIRRAETRRDVRSGDGLRFTLELQEINFPGARRSGLQVSENSSGPATDRPGLHNRGKIRPELTTWTPAVRLAPRKIQDLEGIPLRLFGDLAHLNTAGEITPPQLDPIASAPLDPEVREIIFGQPLPLPELNEDTGDGPFANLSKQLDKAKRVMRRAQNDNDSLLPHSSEYNIIKDTTQDLNDLLSRHVSSSRVPGVSSIGSRIQSHLSIILAPSQRLRGVSTRVGFEL